MADATLEILLQAKNQSAQAFNELKTQLGALQQEFAKTARAAESGFNLDKATKQVVAFGASVYGAFKTAGQAIEMAELGSKLEKQSAAFANLSTAAGTSSQKILSELKTASRGMVAESDLMAASGKALLMGIPAADITKLMEIAAATSKMTGQTITEAFNDITMGVARQSKMILDNLGIIVDVDKAYKDYATTLNKTADALSDTEKRQAFMNAVMSSGQDMIRRLGDSQGQLEGINKAIVAQKGLWDELSVVIAKALDGPLAKYARLVDDIKEKLRSMASGAASEDKSEELRRIGNLGARERAGQVPAGSYQAAMDEFNRKYLAGQMGLKPSEELKLTGTVTPTWTGMDRFRSEEAGAIAAPFTSDEIKRMTEEREKAAAEWQKYLEEQKRELDEFLRSPSGLVNYGAWEEDYQKLESSRMQGWLTRNRNFDMDLWGKAVKGDEAVYGPHKGELVGDELRKAEKELNEFAVKGDERIMKIVDSMDDGFEEMTKLSEETARAMQSNFSDFFFDAMTGKLKTFQDYCSAIFTSIQRAFADMAGQMLTQQIFGKDFKGGGWLTSAFDLVKGIGGAAAGSGSETPSGWVNAWTHHAGGTVDGSGPRRQVPSFVFAGAPRLHNGLAADEFPAILQRGEEVRSRDQARRPAVTMSFNIQSRDGRVDRDSVGQVATAAYSALKRAYARNA